MTEASVPGNRAQSRGEEIANSVSHGVGLLAALAAVPVLVVAATGHGDPARIVGAAVFGATLVTLYLTSTLYHAMPHGRKKRLLRVLDHGAIFLLIAGTYTPFTLGVLRGGWGWTLFGLVWGVCLAGVGLKILRGTKHPGLSITLYIVAGWLMLIAIKPLWESVPVWGLFWLLAGGIAYTAGVVFYAVLQFGYHHLVWHVCVVTGSACHFVAVLRYSA